MSSSTPPVEPRLRARRIEVRRSEGRRRLRAFVALIVATIVGGGAVVVSRSGLADVDAVVVEGATHSDAADVVALSGIVPGQPLIDLDLDAAVEAIETLPWVEGVSVDRRINGEVLVSLVERTPSAVLPTADGGYVLIDVQGRQLERLAARSEEWLPIAGIVASGVLGQPAPPETQAVLALTEALSPMVGEQVSQVVMDQGNLYLELRSGGRARLGDDSSIEPKMIALETMLINADLRCLWEIDVRVPSAPALTRMTASGDPRAALTDLAECT